MKMIKNLSDLAKFVKGGADVLQKAIESEDEVQIDLIDGSLVSDQELESLKTDVFGKGKKEGTTIGYDFAMKDFKKDFGIEVEGKDRNVIVKSVKQKIMDDAKIEPNKKITELEQSLEKLRGTYESDKQNWESQENEYKGKLKNTLISTKLEHEAPDVKGLKKSQFVMLAKAENDFDLDESGTLIAKTKAGDVVKDKMEKPIPVSNILTDFATKNGWFGEKGRDEGDKFGENGKFKSENEAYKYMEENNIMPDSPEGEEILSKV